MKRGYIIALLVFSAMLVVGICRAQTNAAYHCYVVSVNSATVPVQLSPTNPPFKVSAWNINEQSAAAGTPAATNILAFPYQGNVVPTAVPSACASPTTTLTDGGCTEITPTKPLSDSVGCDQPSCVGPIGQPWAGILETGSTAVTAATCIR